MKQFQLCKVCSNETALINNKYNLVECTNCKLVFCNTIFSEETFIKVYDKLYNQTKQYSVHIKESERLLSKKTYKIGNTKRKVLNYITNIEKPKILEIGAGVGVVANYLQNKNFDYLGVEIDKKTVERAKKASLNIIQGDFKSVKSIEESFDSILAFEVIEHIQDLDELFKIIIEKLNSKGILGFTVPNYNKRLNYKNPHEKIFQSGPPIHLNFFTTESIVKIANSYGFNVIYCKEKKFPYFNWNKIDTYKQIIKAIFRQYRGSTIITILQKK